MTDMSNTANEFTEDLNATADQARELLKMSGDVTPERAAFLEVEIGQMVATAELAVQQHINNLVAFGAMDTPMVRHAPGMAALQQQAIQMAAMCLGLAVDGGEPDVSQGDQQ